MSNRTRHLNLCDHHVATNLVMCHVMVRIAGFKDTFCEWCADEGIERTADYLVDMRVTT